MRVRTLLGGASEQSEAQAHAQVTEIVQAFHEVCGPTSRSATSD